MSDTAGKKIEAPLPHTLKVIKNPTAYESVKTARLGRDLIKNRRHVAKFQDWILPEQPTGYIKAKKNEIL
jgi:hypothetical protein